MRWRMPRLRGRLGLPLLAKELVEIANRRSTYVLRVLYALTLFGFVLYFYWQFTYGQHGMPYEILGTGGQLFERIVKVQMWGIYILTPLLTASCIAAEKERDTLQLLFLTRLGPWTILLEKLLGRLVPMSAYLLLTLPVFAVAYSLGGVETSQMVSAAVALVMAMLHAGAVTLFCSTWCRTTASAFLMSFPVLWLSYLIPSVLLQACLGGAALEQIAYGYAFAIGNTVQLPGGGFQPLLQGQDLRSLHIPGILAESSRSVIGRWGGGGGDLRHVQAALPPMLLYFVLFLLLARLCLYRRAQVTSRNYILKMFKAADALLHRWNDRFTRGIVLVRDQGVLPEQHPIHWRETRKRALGTFRYLVRVLVFLEFPALLFGLMAATGGIRTSRVAALSALIGLFWVIAVLGTAVRSATLFAGERSQSTLDVLLTTPMRASEMLEEKVKALQRFMIVLATPLLTSYCIHAATIAAVTHWTGWIVYLLGAFVTVGIYLPLVCWVGVLSGLRSSTQTRALFSVLSVLVLVGYVAPSAFLMLLDGCLLLFPASAIQPLALVAHLIIPTSYPMLLETEPRAMVLSRQLTESGGLSLLLLLIPNTIGSGLLLWGVRRHCLRHCSRMMGRPESVSPYAPPLQRPDRKTLYDVGEVDRLRAPAVAPAS